MVKVIEFFCGRSHFPLSYLDYIPKKAEIIIDRLIPIRDIYDISFYKSKIEIIDKRIILTETYDPEIEPLIQNSRGVISKRGGFTSHVALISRELKKPFVCGGAVSTKDFGYGDLCLLYGDMNLVVFENSWRYLSYLKDLLWKLGRLKFNQIKETWESWDGSEYKIIKDEGIFIKKNNTWHAYDIHDANSWMYLNKDLKTIRSPLEPLCLKCNAHIKLGFPYKDCKCGQKYHEICYDKLIWCLKCNKKLSEIGSA